MFLFLLLNFLRDLCFISPNFPLPPVSALSRVVEPRLEWFRAEYLRAEPPALERQKVFSTFCSHMQEVAVQVQPPPEA